MNFLWIIVIGASIVCLMLVDPTSVLAIMIGSANEALSLSFELLCIYAIWLGILFIVENTKICELLAKFLSPLINLLWGKNSMSPKAKKYLSLSLSTQIFGVGGASVPLGIKAIEEMNDGSGTVTFPMIMTIVFACSGVQIIPSTVMSLMTSSGSNNPSFIIIPTILGGICTTVVGIVLAFLCEFFSKKLKKHSKKSKFRSKLNDSQSKSNSKTIAIAPTLIKAPLKNNFIKR